MGLPRDAELAERRSDWVKVVAIWFEFVSMKNLLKSLAQFFSTVEVGSAGEPVFTWIV